MNYYTLFYLILIIFILFKNIIFEKIIEFNKKNNTKNILNNLSLNYLNLNNLNRKYILVILLSFYVIYKSKLFYKILMLICGVIIYYNYTNINFILNQFKNIYYNQFLINKFILL